MDLNLPAGSEISIRQDQAGPTVVIPAKGNPSRYFGGVFLVFWLGGWAFGFKSVLTMLLSGNGNAFLIFWLGAWTVGGIVAALQRVSNIPPRRARDVHPETPRYRV